jgi:gluconokinase
LADISRGQTGDADWETASAMPVDQHGLTVLPFLAGERAPIWNDRATATISGLRLATTRADLIRAGMEAVTWRLAGLYRSLTESIAGDHQVIANGGAILHSPAWLQLLADAFEHPIIALPPGEEASARGAALLALESAGLIGSLDNADDPARDGRTIAPRPDQAELCQAAMDRQGRLMDALYDRGGHPLLKIS